MLSTKKIICVSATRRALWKFLIILLPYSQLSCDDPNRDGSEASRQEEDLLQLALTDQKAFGEIITAGYTSTIDRTTRVVNWYAENFDWTATDYKNRTVREILERKGGNCNELAMVATTTMKALGLKMRKVREINIHVENESRQARAESRVEEVGPKASVFGRRHNDHVWIEVYDETGGEWFPADPSLGVVGERAWLRARFGFGERFTMDPTSKDMVAPFAVFAMDDHSNIVEDRTRHYVIDGFAGLYDGLNQASTWKEWVTLVAFMDDKARGAFEGKINLHQYTREISQLAELYDTFKERYSGLRQN